MSPAELICRGGLKERGCTVVWWYAPSPHSERVPGWVPGWSLSVWSLHVLPMYAWVHKHACWVHLVTLRTGDLSRVHSWDRLQPPHDPTLH